MLWDSKRTEGQEILSHQVVKWKEPLFCLVTVWPWTYPFSSLSHTCLIYKIEINMYTDGWLGRSNVIVNMKAFWKLQSAAKRCPDLVFWIKDLDCFWGFLSYLYYPCSHPDQKFHKHLTWECSMLYQALGRPSAKWILRSVQKRAEIQWTKVYIDGWVCTCTHSNTHTHTHTYIPFPSNLMHVY